MKPRAARRQLIHKRTGWARVSVDAEMIRAEVSTTTSTMSGFCGVTSGEPEQDKSRGKIMMAEH